MSRLAARWTTRTLLLLNEIAVACSPSVIAGSLAPTASTVPGAASALGAWAAAATSNVPAIATDRRVIP